MECLKYEKLNVAIADSNDELGVAVAEAFASAARAALEVKDEIAVILASGNSQLSFTRAVCERDDIEWSRITVLHMDEYLGMEEDNPAGFRYWMQKNVVEKVHPKGFEGIRGEHLPIEEELERYSALVRDLDPAICVMGIGENGHLAFNDPPADFETTDLTTIVTMDEMSRHQQVGEGHFATLDEMPERSLTLTIPALLRPRSVLVAVPESRKAKAVKATLEGPVTPNCPASLLQTQSQAHVFLDQESSALLDRDHSRRVARA